MTQRLRAEYLANRETYLADRKRDEARLNVDDALQRCANLVALLGHCMPASREAHHPLLKRLQAEFDGALADYQRASDAYATLLAPSATKQWVEDASPAFDALDALNNRDRCPYEAVGNTFQCTREPGHPGGHYHETKRPGFFLCVHWNTP